VVDTLEAAVWVFAGTTCFEDAVLKAVNLGHDADTVGAIVGQIAGAFYGLDGIPE
jgi:ADP-ribosyl-[dinitrogen reductase] hydrolase